MKGWDQSKFDETLLRYAAVSKRTFAEIVNTKLFYVARKAIWFTPKADASKMKAELGAIVTSSVMGKRGRKVNRRQALLAKSATGGAPAAVLILAARLAKSGKGNPFKGVKRSRGIEKMKTALRKMIGGRASSIAFLKSGWLEAVRTLGRLVPSNDRGGGGSALVDESARAIGKPKGGVNPAKEGFTATAEAWNSASAKHDVHGALMRYGKPALERAFADENASMLEYIEKKMRPDVEAANVGLK